MARPSPLVSYIYWQTVIGAGSQNMPPNVRNAPRGSILHTSEHVPSAHTRTNEITTLLGRRKGVAAVAAGFVATEVLARSTAGRDRSLAPSSRPSQSSRAVCSSCSDFHAPCDRSTTTTARHHLFTPGLTSRARSRTARRRTKISFSLCCGAVARGPTAARTG